MGGNRIRRTLKGGDHIVAALLDLSGNIGPHRGAKADAAGDLDMATLQFGKALDHREAETRALIGAVIGSAGLEEGAAKLGNVIIADADAGIADLEDEVAALLDRPAR